MIGEGRSDTSGQASTLRLTDGIKLGALGLRARPLRTALSVLGISIAIASLVAVLGIADSAKAHLLSELGAEANLLTVASGQTFSGNPTPLPASAERMIARIPPVYAVTRVGTVPNVTVRRSAAIPEIQTGGITVIAADQSFTSTLSATVLQGKFLGTIADHFPEVVLGFSAAQYLGIDRISPETQVYVSGSYFSVIGILNPVSVAPEVDDAALISFAQAQSRTGFDGSATRIYLRTDPAQVTAVAAVLPFTASPSAPEAVEVRRPSDILAARIAAQDSFVGLFLALAAVALLVGTVGIANIMVISVFERRTEIGLRRALGARARHVAAQFLFEAVILALIGGVVGVGFGWLATVIAAAIQGSEVSIPLDVTLGGLVAAVIVGTIAGVYPSIRAARLAPADALRSL